MLMTLTGVWTRFVKSFSSRAKPPGLGADGYVIRYESEAVVVCGGCNPEISKYTSTEWTRSPARPVTVMLNLPGENASTVSNEVAIPQGTSETTLGLRATIGPGFALNARDTSPENLPRLNTCIKEEAGMTMTEDMGDETRVGLGEMSKSGI